MAPVVSTPVTTATAVDTSPAGQATSLTRHDGTIVAHSGDVIKNLDIYVNSGEGILLNDADNVTISNVRIHYNNDGGTDEGSGIGATSADGLVIDHVEIFNGQTEVLGNAGNPEQYGIELFNSPGAAIDSVTLHNTSTGIYLQDSGNAVLHGIEGYNMMGPFPRGQLVQFNRSGDSSLTDFYVKNDPTHSWVEDNINVGDSNNVHITNGVIDGNNSPSGQGVIFESSTGGVVSHVDTINMGNGAFADYGSGNTFDFVRSFDNIATDQGRGVPMSGGLIFGLGNDTTLTHASYQNPAAQANVVWGEGYDNGTFTGTTEVTQVTGESPLEHWSNGFLWA